MEENYSSSSSSSCSSDDYADVITEQQLQTLQSLIPNISNESGAKTILEETHDYLQRIHEEAERIERELTSTQQQQQRSENPAGSTAQRDDHGSSQGLQLIRVETEKLREGRFVVKVEWRRGSGTAGDVQRVIESLEVTMTSILVADVNRNPNHMLTTAFVKVKKELRMTEEELYDLIMTRFRSQT